MRGITIAVLFAACIAVALAYPVNKWTPQGGPPSSVSPSSWVRSVKPSPYWSRYRVYQARDDDSDEEEDDAEDDEDGSDEEEDDLDAETPSWDYLFPPEETGNYARREHGSAGKRPVAVASYKPYQNDGATYTLSPGSPGAPRGRSGYSPQPPWSKGSWNWAQSRGPIVVRAPKYIERPTWYNSENRWSGPPSYERPSYAYSKPSPIRRNWFWRPQQVDSAEEPEQAPWEYGPPQPQGPRRVKNWSSPKPSWAPQKWSYY